MTNNSRRVLMINAVVWTAAYDGESPLRDVHGWFARCLADVPRVDLQRVTPQEDVVGMARQGVDGIIISGSPRDAWSGDSVNLKLCELIGVCQERSIPVLGVCYGHQILGRALGGVVARHPQGLELGNTSIELTSSGQASPLFAGMPARFEALSSHWDAVLEMPPGGELLARGDFTANQAFQWNRLLFGVQFHPEFDPEVLRFIWGPRREIWRGKVPFDLDQTLDHLRPTPATTQILRNFVTQIIP